MALAGPNDTLQRHFSTISSNGTVNEFVRICSNSFEFVSALNSFGARGAREPPFTSPHLLARLNILDNKLTYIINTLS